MKIWSLSSYAIAVNGHLSAYNMFKWFSGLWLFNSFDSHRLICRPLNLLNTYKRNNFLFIVKQVITIEADYQNRCLFLYFHRFLRLAMSFFLQTYGKQNGEVNVSELGNLLSFKPINKWCTICNQEKPSSTGYRLSPYFWLWQFFWFFPFWDTVWRKNEVDSARGIIWS